jgi:hypothetical protein
VAVPEEAFLTSRELAFVTVVTRDCLAGARALAHSVRQVAPDATMYICLVDRPPSPWIPDTEPAHCVMADALGIPAWKRVAFQYQTMELACSLKPVAMRYVLDQGFKKVIFVDGDQFFYSRPQAILDALEFATIIVIPHLTQPLSVDQPERLDLAILRAGVYNTGFLAIKQSESADQFLQWWTERLRSECVIDQHGGVFVDQRWMDLAPSLFEGVRIERSLGSNVGYWTLWSNTLTLDRTVGFHIGTAPVVSFHFSGFDPLQPATLSRYDLIDHSIGPASSHAALQSLQAAYAAELVRCGWQECRSWGCEFERLTNGMTISPYWREAIRLNDLSLADIVDPFDPEACPDLVARLTALEPSMRRKRIDWRLAEPDAVPAKLNRWRRFLRRYLGA